MNKYYIRFGEIPENEVSGIYRGEVKVGEEVVEQRIQRSLVHFGVGVCRCNRAGRSASASATTAICGSRTTSSIYGSGG